MGRTLIIPDSDGSPAPHKQGLRQAAGPTAMMLMQADRSRPSPGVWRAEPVVMEIAGHIHVEGGFGPWPGVRQLRDDLPGRIVPAQTDERQDRNHLRALP